MSGGECTPGFGVIAELHIRPGGELSLKGLIVDVALGFGCIDGRPAPARHAGILNRRQVSKRRAPSRFKEARKAVAKVGRVNTCAPGYASAS